MNLEFKIGFRSFTWHDLPTLYRYRNRVQALDSALMLTRGNPVGVASILNYLSPSKGFFTGVLNPGDGQETLIGQFYYLLGERTAHLAYISPDDRIDSRDGMKLIEGLVSKAAELGAYNFLIEVPEQNRVFEQLRQSGFCVYSWQQVWRMPEATMTMPLANDSYWQATTPIDEEPVRRLCHSLVSPLVESAELFSMHQIQGLMYHKDSLLQAYVEIFDGPRGIYLKPFIHPSVENITTLLDSLVTCLSPLMGRPVYLAVGAHQAWLEVYLERMKWTVSPRQALMVKRLAVPYRERLELSLPVIEAKKAHTSAPTIRNISQSSQRR
jgi:hypothetical protein